MNKNLLYFTVKISSLVLLLISGIITQSQAQTVLTAGDIAVIGFKTSDDIQSGDDAVKLLTLVDLACGTTFVVTDNNWKGTGTSPNWYCSNDEFGMMITVTANICAGTVIYIDLDDTGKPVSSSSGALARTDLTSSSLGWGNNFGLNDEGDNVFVLQFPGIATPSHTDTPTFIYAFKNGDAYFDQSCSSKSTGGSTKDNTNLPSSLSIASGTALLMPNIDNSNDNDGNGANQWHYKCSSTVSFSSKASALSSIKDVTNNWEYDATENWDETSCGFTLSSFDCSQFTTSCVSCNTNQYTPSGSTISNSHVSWNNNGAEVILIAWDNNKTPTGVPTNNTTYTPNYNYTLGASVGTGKVVYSGTSTKPDNTITNVTSSKLVNFAVYEMISCNGKTCYLPSTGTCSSSLPISLIYQAVVKEADKYIVEWSTASEINSAYYEIQASKDGVNFIYIDQYPAKGNTSALSVYQASFTSTENYPYVRIKQTDADGRYEYFEVMLVQDEISDQDFEIFPVPATDDLFVRSLSSAVNEKNTEAAFFISSVVGNVLQSGTFDFDSDHIVKPLSVAGFDTGIYLLTIKLSDRIIVKRFVVEE